VAPVVEMQYDAFSYPCLDQLITHVGRYPLADGGRMGFPLVVRMPYGGGVRRAGAARRLARDVLRPHARA
jgi:pyruvate/2-oxoglutarate/acetoin dehydrogenase E1 component